MIERHVDQYSPTWQKFEDLVARILEANHYVVRTHSPRGDAGYDLDGQFRDDRWAIEVKYYRTARAQPSLLESAAVRLVNNGVTAQATKGMLVVSCVLSDSLKNRLTGIFGITFVDRNILRGWAAVVPSLVEELDALVEADPKIPVESNAEPTEPPGAGTPLVGAVAILKSEGADLCKEMKKIKRGREGWVEYERVCARILQYLFPNDLQGWHKQKRTDDGLNRFDFVCRVRPTTEFWKFLIDHLNSRYILFEFKNYDEKIGQGQVLTTEKYLLERGLRRVAIVFTRKGADAAAMKMAQGSMREHGKLILVVNDKQVCKMLHMKDRGEDPTDSLFEVADNFLLSLPR